MKTKSYYAIIGSLLFASAAHAQSVVYSESFDTAPSFLVDFNFQLGGVTDPLPASTKALAFGQWGLTTNGSFPDIGGNNGIVLQPQQVGKENGRTGLVFLDPALFSATGAGTYTLSFDVIPSSTPGAGRVYIGTGSGYDLSGSTDAKLHIPVAAAGFNLRKADGTLLWPALTGQNGASAGHHLTTSVEWVLTDGTATGDFRDTPGTLIDVVTAATLSFPFVYDGTSAVVIGFAGYNTDYGVDNIRIESAAPAASSWAGFPMDANGSANTGSWLGWVNAGKAPWIWVYALSQWCYVAESTISQNGAWAFVPR